MSPAGSHEPAFVRQNDQLRAVTRADLRRAQLHRLRPQRLPATIDELGERCGYPARRKVCGAGSTAVFSYPGDRAVGLGRILGEAVARPDAPIVIGGGNNLVLLGRAARGAIAQMVSVSRPGLGPATQDSLTRRIESKFAVPLDDLYAPGLDRELALQLAGEAWVELQDIGVESAQFPLHAEHPSKLDRQKDKAARQVGPNGPAEAPLSPAAGSAQRNGVGGRACHPEFCLVPGQDGDEAKARVVAGVPVQHGKGPFLLLHIRESIDECFTGVPFSLVARQTRHERDYGPGYPADPPTYLTGQNNRARDRAAIHAG